MEAGPDRVRKCYAPNSRTNAAKARVEAMWRVGNLQDQRARAGMSGCHGRPSSCPTRGSAAAVASILCSPQHAYQKQWCGGLGQRRLRLAVLQARPMANQKLMRQDTRQLLHSKRGYPQLARCYHAQ